MLSENKEQNVNTGEQITPGTESAETLAKRRAARKAAAKKKSKKKLFVIVSLIIVVLALGGFLGYKFFFGKQETKAETTEAEVTRGNIVNVIEGSGTIEAKAQYEVKYLNSVDVVADYFEEGDYVKKDQVLYQMDSKDIQRNITKQQRNVEKAQMSYDEAVKNVSDLNVKTDIKGVITNLYVSKGDSVSNGTKIADVVDKDTLVLTIPFGADDAKGIKKGDIAEVTILNSLTNLSGKVTNVGSGTYVNSYGVEVTDVEIEVSNPSSVSEDTVATAVVGDYACYDSAPLKYGNSKTILAKANGEVSVINKKKGDAVSAGATLVKLVSDNSDKTIKEAKMSLEDAKSSLDQLMESKEDATIRAEIDGKVIQKNIKAGEILDSNTSSTMAIIADLSSLKFNMSIDELDISKISVGQEVTITADALSGQTFKGSVTNVSIVGTAYQGVTSYPVTVTIENAEETDLIPGMNVEAQIVIDSAENVLRVPVSALRAGNLIIVKDDGTFTDPLKADMSKFMSDRFKGRSTSGNLSNLKGSTQSKTSADSSKESTEEKNTSADEAMPGKTGQGQGRGEENASSQGWANRGGFGGGGRPTPGGEKNSSDGNASNVAASPSRDKGTPDTSNLEKTTKKASTSEKGRGNEVLSEDMIKQQKERLKGMIGNLDIPEGYTVVLVKTGLNDGSFVEIEEIEGSLKEGDMVLIPAVVNSGTQNQFGMPGGGMFGGGMPGGGMPGGGMPRGNMSGGNTNRQNIAGGASRQSGGAMR